ncbi:MAG: hypothetical protein BVN29_07945 [Nitrospira sp. ST-bin5]|nr:MAG: hypothetical protein BVN29_07945 [Nitrospira sp. ST-bin5]
MFDVSKFRLQDMTACSAALRQLGAGASSIDIAADRITRYLYATLTTGADEDPACVLVRLFKTHPYERLSPELQALADVRLGDKPANPGMKCLTLLASTGTVEGWNHPAQSSRFRVIPLDGPNTLANLPMFSQLFAQFHIDLPFLEQAGSSLLMDQYATAFNAFHVPQALGSPYVPGQTDFVVPFGIQSVFGFGGLLSTGEMFAVILFAKVPVTRETADLCKAFALSTKLALAPFEHNRLFVPQTVTASPVDQALATNQLASLQDRVATLESILAVQEHAVEVQSEKLEAALAEAVRQGQKLQKQSVRFEALSATSPVGIFETDADGACLYTNAAWQAIAGVTLADTLGDGWSRAISEEDRRHVFAAWNHAANAGEDFSLEFRLQRSDGMIRWVHARSRPLKNHAGVVTGHVDTTEDITARKQAHETLQKSEERYRRYFELGLVGMAVTSPGKGWIQVNDRLCQIFGHSPDELATKTWTELTHPDDVAQDLAQFNRVLAGDIDNYTLDKRFIHREGRIIYATISASAVRREDGSVDHFVALVQDITARHEAEERLKESERRLQQQIDEMPIGHIVWDRDFGITSWNPAAERIFGYTSSEAIGRHASFLIPEEFRSHVDDVWQRLIDGDKTAHSTNDNLTKDGRRIACQWVNTPLRNAGGQVVGAFSMVQDVTEQKMTQDALRQSEARLLALTDTVPVLIWIADTTKSCVWFNKGWLDFSGRTLEQEYGNGWADGVHPDDYQRCLDTYVAAFGRREPFEMEYRLKRHDGHYRWLLDRGRPQYDAGGIFTGYIGGCIDIQEAKTSAETLRMMEERWTYAFDGSGDGVWDWDTQTNHVFFSNRWKEMLGYAEDEIGSTLEEWSSRVHPDDLASAMADVQRHFRGETSAYANEHRLRCKDGSYKWILDRGKVISRAPDGSPLRVVGTHTDITDRKRTEDCLHRALAIQEPLISHAGYAIIATDPSGLITRFNPAAERLLGYSAEEMIGKQTPALFHEHAEVVARAAEFGTELGITIAPGFEVFVEKARRDLPNQHEWTYIRKDGHRIPVMLSVTALRDSSGTITGYIAMALDLTDRNTADAQFQTVMEAMPTGIILVDDAGHITMVNQHVGRMFGYEPVELLGQPVEVLLPERFRAAHPTHVRTFFRSPTARAMGAGKDLSGLRKDGTEFFLEIGLAPIHTPQGVRIVASIADITKRKQMESTRFRLQQAVNHAQDGMALLDEAGEFTYMNPAYATIFGYAVDDLLGKRWTQLYPEEWAAMIEQMHLPMLHSAGQWQGEVVGKRKSGDAFHVDLALSLLEEPGTGRQSILSTCRDISYRKQMELDLINAKNAAEAGIRAKSEFLATMSHEIRTPMNGVLGMTDLLIDTALTPEQREFVHTLKHSGESLMRIINDILDFSKIEAGKLTIETLPFDLRMTIEDTLDLLAPTAQAKHLELVGLIDAQAPNAVIGDPGRIRQILTNLIGNAIKFTESGEVLVQVLKAEESAASVLLRFEIVDTGVGLTEEAKAKLFQSFTQADSSTARKYGGTGLGLAICKRLTELMGGQIGIQSFPGSGTCVWFTIRLLTQTESTGLPAPALIDNLSGLRICLVDDNATNRSLLQYHACDWKMKYDSAEDGPSALALIRRAATEGKPFDLAILDMHMPGMDGLALGRAIRDDANLDHTRLVLLTSLGRRGDAKVAHASGFSAYLTKPVRKKHLYDCLRLVMGQAQATHADTPAAAPAPPLITRHQVAEMHAHVRLLVVDDNLVNQKVAVKMLEKLGYRVDVAGNGNEGLAALSRHAYTLVFMDCQMPELDGFETTRMIRAHEQPGTHLPIIAMTANAMEGDREHCLSSGMDDFVSKPVKSQDLHRVLTQWLSPSDNRAAA